MPDEDAQTGRMPTSLPTSSVTVAAVLFSETIKVLAANGWEPIPGDAYPYWWRNHLLPAAGRCSISAALRYCWLGEASRPQQTEDIAGRIVDFLNELLGIDPTAITSLIEFRVPCNEGMANHPAVQSYTVARPRVGMLGILNGLAGAPKGWDEPGSIEAVFEDEELAGFRIRAEVKEDE